MEKDVEKAFSRMYELSQEVVKKYLLSHPLPYYITEEDFYQGVYEKMFIKCQKQADIFNHRTNSYLIRNIFWDSMNLYEAIKKSNKKEVIDENVDYNEMIESTIDEKNNFENIVFLKIMKEDIQKVLNMLTPREKLVLEMRFGLNRENIIVFKNIAKKFGVTPERIRQIEAKALRKLRHPSRSDYLEGYLKEVV